MSLTRSTSRIHVQQTLCSHFIHDMQLFKAYILSDLSNRLEKANQQTFTMGRSLYVRRPIGLVPAVAVLHPHYHVLLTTSCDLSTLDPARRSLPQTSDLY